MSETSDKLFRIAQRYYRDRGCCSVICLATATGISFGKAFHAMRRAGRQTGHGANLRQIQAAFAEKGYMLRDTAEDLRGATVTQAFRRLPAGRVFAILIRGHIFTFRDGAPQDWIEPGRRHKVKRIFEVHKIA